METRVMFSGGPWDGEELPIDTTPEGGLPDRWFTLQENWAERDIADMLSNPLGMNLRASHTQIRHEYHLTVDRTGRPVYVHQDEKEW